MGEAGKHEVDEAIEAALQAQSAGEPAPALPAVVRRSSASHAPSPRSSRNRANSSVSVSYVAPTRRMFTLNWNGFTIHSVQGETYEGKIFIDIIDTSNIFDLTMLCTAVSRARQSDQIYVIVGLEDHKTLPGKIYIIESPNTNEVYVGSTFQELEKRFRWHKAPTNKTESKRVINADNAANRLLKNVECASKGDLEDHERACIKMYPNALNKKLTAGS